MAELGCLVLRILVFVAKCLEELIDSMMMLSVYLLKILDAWCRNPPPWGTMKYLSEKIPKDASSMVRINRDLYSYEKKVIMETALALPDFALALTPDEYQLPPVDPSWNENVQWSHMGRNHVNPDQRQNSNIRNARGKWKISPTPFAAILWRLRSGIFILMVRSCLELPLVDNSFAEDCRLGV
ncbi:hypothetical protein V6N12_020450 [Hibiscus sabdariffa]|uniref:Uncharacterized protein n=1 Tax=Hibiscus sabdariffa TaxID=183260 RepID=A0ABR2CY51_9ROSI